MSARHMSLSSRMIALFTVGEVNFVITFATGLAFMTYAFIVSNFSFMEAPPSDCCPRSLQSV